MKISKEDLPEEMLNNIKYISEHGSSYFMENSDKDELESLRRNAILKIKKYKQFKAKIIESKQLQNKYKELAEKLGI